MDSDKLVNIAQVGLLVVLGFYILTTVPWIFAIRGRPESSFEFANMMMQFVFGGLVLLFVPYVLLEARTIFD